MKMRIQLKRADETTGIGQNRTASRKITTPAQITGASKGKEASDTKDEGWGKQWIIHERQGNFRRRILGGN